MNINGFFGGGAASLVIIAYMLLSFNDGSEFQLFIHTRVTFTRSELINKKADI